MYVLLSQVVVCTTFLQRQTHADVDTYKHASQDSAHMHVTLLKEYSSLQDNPYNVRFIHTVLIVHNYFAPRGVDNVLISESSYCTARPQIAPGGCHDGTHLLMTS